MLQIYKQFETGKENPGAKTWQERSCQVPGGSFLTFLRKFSRHNPRGFYPEEPVLIEPFASP